MGKQRLRLVREFLSPRCYSPKNANSQVGGTNGTANQPFSLAAVWACVAAVTALHFMTPFPYDDYQVMVFPLAAAALAAALLRVVGACAERCGTGADGARRLAGVVVAAVLVVQLVMACASPMLQGWFVGKRDRIWWPLRKEFPLAKIGATRRPWRAGL